MTADYQILLDVPADANLALSFGELADAFKGVIENSKPRFAVGIFGGWGSGKSTLMEAIAQRLNPRDCAVVRFSAWRYEKEQHLIVPLLDTVREGLVVWHDANPAESAQLKRSAKQVASTIGKVIASLLTGFSLKASVPGVAEVSYDMNKAITRADAFDEADTAARVPRSFYHASFNALREAFADFIGPGPDRRIVVFVDDLDRCLPEGALEILEAMKLFFDIPGFVFVVGVDLRVVEFSIEQRYRGNVGHDGKPEDRGPAQLITGANYVRKIFQVPYSLAPVSTAQVDDLLESIRSTAMLPQSQWDEINTRVRPHLRFLADASGLNPREVKRFINAYTLVRKIRPTLDQDIVLALQTIASRADWRAVQFALLTFREAFIDALRRHVQAPDAGHLEGLASDLAGVPQSFATYIDSGQPGHALVQNQNYLVSEYIYSGEATRSTTNSTLLDLFREIGGLLPLVRETFRGEKPLDALASQTQSVRSQLASPDTALRATRVIAELAAAENLLKLAELKTAFDTLRPPGAAGPDSEAQAASPDDVRQARAQAQTVEQQVIDRIRNAIGQLRELYQAV